jgi:hypothetical protein
MQEDGGVYGICGGEVHSSFRQENVKEGGHLDDPGINGRVI